METASSSSDASPDGHHADRADIDDDDDVTSEVEAQQAEVQSAPLTDIPGQATKLASVSNLTDKAKGRLKVKDKEMGKPKKKKNRLGQRARQQLGRAKQGQSMGFVQSNKV